MKAERKRASELALYYAANFYLQLQIFDKAKELTELIFQQNQSSVRGWLIKGWLELNGGNLTNAIDCFNNVLLQVRYVYLFKSRNPFVEKTCHKLSYRKIKTSALPSEKSIAYPLVMLFIV